MAIPGGQRRLDVTRGLARAAIPTTLWNTIPITMDRIMGLNVVMPGSCLMANAVPSITEFRNRLGSRRVHRWMVDGRRAVALPFTDSASLVLETSLVLEIRGMSWLHQRSNPISVTSIDQSNR